MVIIDHFYQYGNFHFQVLHDLVNVIVLILLKPSVPDQGWLWCQDGNKRRHSLPDQQQQVEEDGAGDSFKSKFADLTKEKEISEIMIMT